MTPVEALAYLGKEAKHLRDVENKPGRAAKIEACREAIFGLVQELSAAKRAPRDPMEEAMEKFLKGRKR